MLTCTGTLTTITTGAAKGAPACSSAWTELPDSTATAIDNFRTSLEFDATAFSAIVVIALTTFVVGHGIGRVARIMGKI